MSELERHLAAALQERDGEKQQRLQSLSKTAALEQQLAAAQQAQVAMLQSRKNIVVSQYADSKNYKLLAGSQHMRGNVFGCLFP